MDQCGGRTHTHFEPVRVCRPVDDSWRCASLLKTQTLSNPFGRNGERVSFNSGRATRQRQTFVNQRFGLVQIGTDILVPTIYNNGGEFARVVADSLEQALN